MVRFAFWLQCGSEIQSSLYFKWSKKGWFANGPDFKSEHQKAQPCEIRTNGQHFVNHLKSGQKHPFFEWPGFWMAGTIAIATAIYWPFENQTIWNPVFKKSWFQMFPFLEMVRFQILAVFKLIQYCRHTILTQIGFLPFDSINGQFIYPSDNTFTQVFNLFTWRH